MQEPERVDGWGSMVEDCWLPCEEPELVAHESFDDLLGPEHEVRERVPLTVPVLPLRNTVLFPRSELLFACCGGSSSADKLIDQVYEEADRAAGVLDQPSCLWVSSRHANRSTRAPRRAVCED